MISPSNSYPGLTRAAPFVPCGSAPRAVSDGNAELRHASTRPIMPKRRRSPCSRTSSASSSVYLLHDGPEYGQAMATMLRKAAGRLGLEIARHQPVGFRRREATAISPVNPAVRRGGRSRRRIPPVEYGRLLHDLREELAGETVLMAPDSFADPPRSFSISPARRRTASTSPTRVSPTRSSTTPASSSSPTSRPPSRAVSFRGSPERTPPSRPRSCSTRSHAPTGRAPRSPRSSSGRRSRTACSAMFAFDENGDITAPAITILRLGRRTSRANRFRIRASTA